MSVAGQCGPPYWGFLLFGCHKCALWNVCDTQSIGACVLLVIRPIGLGPNSAKGEMFNTFLMCLVGNFIIWKVDERIRESLTTERNCLIH